MHNTDGAFIIDFISIVITSLIASCHGECDFADWTVKEAETASTAQPVKWALRQAALASPPISTESRPLQFAPGVKEKRCWQQDRQKGVVRSSILLVRPPVADCWRKATTKIAHGRE